MFDFDFDSYKRIKTNKKYLPGRDKMLSGPVT